MANKTDIAKEPAAMHGENRAKVKALVGEGYAISAIARAIGLSRQRVHILATLPGVEGYSPTIYPRMKPCRTTKETDPHYFMAHSHRQHRCDVHRRHERTCALCGRQYATAGGTITCQKCRKNAYARQYYLVRREVAQ